MRIVILCGQLYPTKSNNTTLLSNLLPHLKAGNELRLVATCRPGTNPSELPEEYEGIPIEWLRPNRESSLHAKLTAVYAKLVDRNGYSDAVLVRQYRGLLSELYGRWRFTALLSISEPFPAAAAGATFAGKLHTAVYFMDPPKDVQGAADTPYRSHCFRTILRKYRSVFSTPFFRDALMQNGFDAFCAKTHSVGFPIMTEETLRKRRAASSETISLLFTGWMCSDIRSPQYFLDIVSRLDERFTVTFMGRECEKLQQRFPTQSRAKLITLPQQPYETALQAMADADVLINIGNSVPVHMPSKTLEYINTGKPIVNFYKMDNCPTLYYTNRYPICLNLSEREAEPDAAAARFIDFCVTNKGKVVDRGLIEREYADCTPQYIANVILDALES
ncbi:MAG: hypothetical protein IKO68_13170 [Oscillospiraceae bacterium]|nr:hypothetical protein [Oscillospiraceae bacterium]